MRFDLTAPCADCPFRADKPFPLKADRVREILGDPRRPRGQWWPADSFVCHRTVDYDCDDGHVTSKSQQCAGVMIILHREGRYNQAMQLAERFGLWNPDRLDMAAPVYFSTQDAINGCTRADGDESENDSEASTPPPSR